MKKIIIVILLVVFMLYLFTFNIFAIDALPSWNLVNTLRISDSIAPSGGYFQQPLYSTEFQQVGSAKFYVTIPLAGEDWQVDPTKAIEFRIMLMMVNANVNYNTTSKKISKIYFSEKINGIDTVGEAPAFQLASHDFTEYSYIANFGNAQYETGGGVSGGLETTYIDQSNGMYTGRGMFFDVVINANAFQGMSTTPKAIVIEFNKFTTTTSGDGRFLFSPYIGIRNIVPTQSEYLAEILTAIQALQNNGGMTTEEMQQAVISALETYEEANQEKFGGEAENLADDIIGEYLPDRATLENAVGQLNDALSYSGTDCVITFPAISILGYTLSNSIEVNLTQYLDTFFSQNNLSVLLNFIRVFVTLGMSVAVIKMYFDFFTSLLSGEWKSEKYIDKTEQEINHKSRR